MAPSASRKPEASKAGITTSVTGDRVIPASTRADGSQRREIRVRPGYRPPEDVEVYKNRTSEAWKNRGTGGIPGAEGLQDDREDDQANGAKTKNAKRREAKKRAKAAAAAEDGAADDEKTEQAEEHTQTSEVSAGAKVEEVAPEEKAQADQEKKIKRLKKRLREARELQAKKDKGERLLLEQLEKAIKINELIRDLEKLGVHEEGGEAPPVSVP